MGHFYPLNWHIDVSRFSAADLQTNTEAQAVFVHEYVHYLQTLASTMGRDLLLALTQATIHAGLHLQYDGNIPERPDQQICLGEILKSASPSDFDGSAPRAQYKDLVAQLRALLEVTECDHPGTYDPSAPFVRLPFSVGGDVIPDFINIIVRTAQGQVAIPLTDRVLFDNMARQIQRRYLFYNNKGDASAVDAEQQGAGGDRIYLCLHDLIRRILPSVPDVGEWTITLCQVCLLCRNPASAFEHVMDRLVGLSGKVGLEGFIERLRKDSWFDGEHNVPPLQQVVDELSAKWGSAVCVAERHELHELIGLVAKVHNVAMGTPGYFAEPLLTWATVRGWLESFGCPPVKCSDGLLDQFGGVVVSMPWRAYFQEAERLL